EAPGRRLRSAAGRRRAPSAAAVLPRSAPALRAELRLALVRAAAFLGLRWRPDRGAARRADPVLPVGPEERAGGGVEASGVEVLRLVRRRLHGAGGDEGGAVDRGV